MWQKKQHAFLQWQLHIMYRHNGNSSEIHFANLRSFQQGGNFLPSLDSASCLNCFQLTSEKYYLIFFIINEAIFLRSRLFSELTINILSLFSSTGLFLFTDGYEWGPCLSGESVHHLPCVLQTLLLIFLFSVDFAFASGWGTVFQKRRHFQQ